MRVVLLLLLACFAGGEAPPLADYCERLEQDIQGRKHGFLAGNVTYYIGGFHASWDIIEHETIGLTHPFHHDLRSRGAGLVESGIEGSEHTGLGNDYLGWEFYKDTRVLYGSVIVDGERVETPVPTRMRWRPDKVICEYRVGDVTIREEKFIGKNDAAASIITSSKPITLEFNGHSFWNRNSTSSTASIKHVFNGLVIKEGGTVTCRPDPDGPERVGPCVYEGMSTALCLSRTPSEAVKLRTDKRGVQHYTVRVPCDAKGTTVSWAMHDEEGQALQAAEKIIEHDRAWLTEKTAEMNRLLNEQIPWFRCPDERFVDIYYYLWSLYLMYHIEVGKGWEMEGHTQTAVNNFLGIHRYDAAFQIKVGAWIADKPKYAYGNVLTWKHLTENKRYREAPDGLRMLADNKGIAWHSGAYGVETCEHVLGAWQIYEHTGDVTFLKRAYEGHFKDLFWKRMPSFAMNQFEVADRLEDMARLTGNEVDVAHWQGLVRRDPEHIRLMFDQRWGTNGIENYFAAPDNKMLMTLGFWPMRSPYYPQEYAKPMVDDWALDSDKGFYGDFFPLAMAKQSMETFASQDDLAFGYTPDTAYFTIDGMFRQGQGDVASRLTLNHLENYNWHEDWKIPVAPEAYRRDLRPFGDQYSNFNAGKILLYLEGLAGVKVSIPERTLSVRPALPKAWEWMEVRLPIEGKWTTARITRDGADVRGCPLKVVRE